MPAPTDCRHGCDTTTLSGDPGFRCLARWRPCLPQKGRQRDIRLILKVENAPYFSTVRRIFGTSFRSQSCDPLRRVRSTGVLVSDRSNLLLKVFARSCPLKQKRDTDLRSRHADGSLSTNQFHIQIARLAEGRRFAVLLLLVAPTFLDDRS